LWQIKEQALGLVGLDETKEIVGVLYSGRSLGERGYGSEHSTVSTICGYIYTRFLIMAGFFKKISSICW